MGIPYAEVIGDPIAHSKSPLIHDFWLKKLGIDADYRAVRVTPEELPRYLSSRRGDPDWRGCNATMPLKRAAMPHLDEVDDSNVGAVNCIVPKGVVLAGYNTDMFGVIEPFDSSIDTGRPLCLIGAGGAAAAAIAGLDIVTVHQFHIVARDPRKGRELIDRFGMAGEAFSFADAPQALQGAAGAINCSPLGMAGFDPMPEPVLQGLRGVHRRGFVFDMVYDPRRTPFLIAGARAGLRTLDGLVMLIGQAAAAFELFFGAPAPREHDDELRALLSS